MGILFQTSKGQNSFIFDEFWWFLWIFDIKKRYFFSKVKNPKNFWRPNSVSPHPGRGTLWYHIFNLKPKSIITRLRIVSFQWFLDQNDRNFMGILFQRSKGQNSFIFDEFWWFFWFFDIKIWPFFSKVKNPKNFPRPNSVSPHPGRGIWYHKVPYGTLWYHMVPYDPPPGVGRDAVGTPIFFGFLTFETKKHIFYIKKIQKSSLPH